ncbi:MAG: hypothetical protein HFJ65_02695 [Eggerthellaceae bacterium]|nr:hypothetical protein [Eggerthellaceae bacterium]
MFDVPHFDFIWEEIYTEWQSVCEEEGIEPSTPQVLEYDIDSSIGSLDLDDEYDWIPFASKVSQVGPKRRSVKGHAYYTARAPRASEITVSMLMNNIADEEVVANVWMMACALQLDVNLPSFWRGMHNPSFLNDLYLFCKANMGDKLIYEWGGNSKRIFPQKFFSSMLLETTDHLTMAQFVRFAALNAQYYLSEWVVVKYTIDGMPVREYRKRRTQEACRLLGFSLSEDSPEEIDDEDSIKKRNPKNDNALQHKRPKLLVPGNRSGELREGKRKRRLNDAIERNATARRICLEHYGPTCVVCGMNFEEEYGSDFAGIIDVHHLAPLSQKEGDHLVDPIEDIVPVCPNCHRMLHRKRDGVYSPDELRAIIGREQGKQGA